MNSGGRLYWIDKRMVMRALLGYDSFVECLPYVSLTFWGTPLTSVLRKAIYLLWRDCGQWITARADLSSVLNWHLNYYVTSALQCIGFGWTFSYGLKRRIYIPGMKENLGFGEHDFHTQFLFSDCVTWFEQRNTRVFFCAERHGSDLEKFQRRT